MTLNRFNPRRDGNEPEIRKRLAHHGWHTEQLSGKGMPDLLCWPFTLANKEGIATWGRRAVLVDVKEPTGKPTAAQVLKWRSLKDKGIPVYVARTPEDVDAIVAGTAEPWGVMEARPRKKRNKTAAPAVGGHVVSPEAFYLPPQRYRAKLSKPSYTPPRTIPGLGAEMMQEMRKPPGQEDYEGALSRALKAAKEAEVFAPPHDEPCQSPGCIHTGPCPEER